MSVQIELPEVSKLHATASFHRLMSMTATTINAATSGSSSSISSSCSSYSSGSSSTNKNLSTNMCSSSSSSSSSTTTNNNSSKFIDISGFINFIAKSVILDCRVLKEFENKHIKNSVHINCRDKITKKRLSTKKLSVKDIIGCEETKKKIESYCGLFDTAQCDPAVSNAIADNENLIVLYDDSTNDDNDLYLDQNPLQIVLDNIKHTFKNNNCKILKGGFKEFSKQFPQYCVQKEKIAQPNCNANYYANCEESFKYAIDNAKLTKITEFLYLGNECDAKNEELLRKEGITRILNVTKNIANYHENVTGFNYKRVPVNDACNQNLRQFFEETTRFIDEAKENNTKVLVHCQAGISRSPTIVIAYLMKSQKMSMNDAYNAVKDKRQIIGPNIIFLSQLYEYEKSLNESSNNVEKCEKIISEESSSASTASVLVKSQNSITKNLGTMFSFRNNNTTLSATTTNNNNNAATVGIAFGGFITHMPMVES